jgi:NADH-quinone oxidoreductase subunit L
LADRFAGLKPALDNRWYVDRFYNDYIVNPLRWSADWFAVRVDRAAIDGLVNAMGGGSLRLGQRLRYIQTGATPTYALSILAGVVVLVAYFVLAS